MLNKNQQRELCYIVKIDDIRPIPGKDRVECACVGGWTVMVRKDQFKPGDVAVFFEIDSKCPDTEPFAFLEKCNYKIKTQKYSTADGGKFYSQGLVMHGSDFGWENIADENGTVVGYKDNDRKKEYRIGDFLTDILGVTYADEEDNVRKEKTDNNSIMKKHKKFFSNKLVKFLMRYKFFRTLLYRMFAPKKKKKKSDYPYWVKKTDEERITNLPHLFPNCPTKWVVTEKVDGCLDYKVSIVTDQGIFSIGEIVNKKMPVNVLTYNEQSGKCEYKPIEKYHKYDTKTDMYDIVVAQYGYSGGNKSKHIRCTSNHMFYVGDGNYVEAKDLRLGDTLYHRKMMIDNLSKEILLGILLGDGSLSNKYGVLSGAVDFCHSVKQGDYFYETLRLLGSNRCSVREQKSGYGSDILHGHFYTNAEFKEIAKNICYVDGKKYVTKEWANELTPISLAFWYMDDGAINNPDSNARPTIVISTNAFSFEECQNLVNALETKFSIKAEIRNGPSYKGNVVYMNTTNADKFFLLVAPYVMDSMKYKLPSVYRDIKYCLGDHNTHCGNSITPTKIVSISKIEDHKPGVVYDLTVADNHNYFACGVLTHNSSSTFTMRNDRKRKLYVCSRNVLFDTPEKEERNFYKDSCGNIWLEAAGKYNMEENISLMIDDLQKLLGKKIEFVTIQGEVYGGSIQKRNYGDEHRLAIFNVIYKCVGETPVRMNPVEGSDFCSHYGLPFVPVLQTGVTLPATCQEVVDMAGGKSVIDGGMREGLVFRSEDGVQSFKAVDPEFLVKYHNG